MASGNEMQGVDVYNPVDDAVPAHRRRPSKVAAWFLDTDYDGRTFCITQAFFPDESAWGEARQGAERRMVDEDDVTSSSGALWLQSTHGERERAAVKVIDPRGRRR